MIGNGYSCAWGTISREGGSKKASSAIGKTAYDCRLDFTDEETGDRFNYTQRPECLAFGTSMPNHAPAAWRDKPEVLAKAMKAAESRKNAQEGWTLRHSLPRGLTDKEKILLTKNISRKVSADLGLAATWAIHPDRKTDNPHVHHIISTREVTKDGFGKKRRDLKDKAHLAKVREIIALECAAMLQRAAAARTSPEEKSALNLSAERWRLGHKTLPEQAAAARKRGDYDFAEHCKQRMGETTNGKIVRLDVPGAEKRKAKNAERDKVFREKKAKQLRPTVAETGNAKKYGVDLGGLSAGVAAAFGKATTHQAFSDNLKATGYKLALNEWKGKDGTAGKSLCIVGKKGDVWSLYRTIGRTNPNISNRQLNAVIDGAKLPTVDRALVWKRAVEKSGTVIGRTLAGIASGGSVAVAKVQTVAAFVKEQTGSKPQQPAKARPAAAQRVQNDYVPPRHRPVAAALPSRAQSVYSAIADRLGAAIEAAMSDSTKTPEERQAIVAALQARLSTEPAAAMKRVMEEEKQTEAAAAKAEKTKGRDSGAMARKAHKIILGYALVAIFLLPSVGADSRGQGFTFQIPSFALMASLGIGVVALLASLVSFRSRPVLRGALTVAALIVFITAGTELYNQPPSGFIYDATGCLTKPKWYETVVTDKNGNRGCAIMLEETSIDRSPPKSMCELDVFKDSKMCRTKQN